MTFKSLGIKVFATCPDCHAFYGDPGRQFDTLEQAQAWAEGHTVPARRECTQGGRHDSIRIWRAEVSEREVAIGKD